MPTPILPDGLLPVIPDVEGRDAPFWEGTRKEELRIQRCQACSAFQWLPEWICHHCHSMELDFQPVAPTGTIYSWERVWHPFAPELAPYCPFVIAVVELDDAPGILMVGNLVGDGGQSVTIGSRVAAAFEHHDSYSLVQWNVSS